MPADLHIHSNFSDGALSPEEIVQKAKQAGLSKISITDHDTVDGIDRAIKESVNAGIKVVPGIEFTTDVPGTEIHILGYFIDHHAQWLLDLLMKIRSDRVERVHKTVDKLKSLGIEINPDDVLRLSNKGSVGRPHIARVLMQTGKVSSIQEAFNRYLDFKSPAYVPHFKLTPVEAIKAIIKAGGIPVYAHPAVSNKDEMIPDLVAAGLAGLEVYYSKHSKFQIKHYLDLASKHGLLVTGGSDFHGLGTGRDVALGDVKLADDLYKKLEEFKLNETAESNVC